MSIVAKLKKDELKLVAEEVGLTAPRDAKRVDLKRLIEASDVFEEDYEFVKAMIEQVLEVKTQESQQNGQIELERLKLERVKAKLELAQLRTSANNSETSFNAGETEASIDALIKSVTTLTIKVPSKSEGWGFFFKSLERAYCNKNVPEKFKAEILLNLLGDRASQIF
ncbi:uncharacterized protein TNCT_350941 [Trichonephila clavata]|uniref:Uncharacterized protein n=1 Tax=Trichonephila clavata TaxID=2740835 RepID=A0A8X6FZ17_TRICU|nr:uncharacterized protein TNCT_350941 [Trichonephila clavata]